MRKLRDDHAELIDRIKQLAGILDPSKYENRAVIAEVGDLERYVPLLQLRCIVNNCGMNRVLKEILVILEAECQLSWFQRVRKTQELKENVLSCATKLDVYIERLTVCAVARFRHSEH